MPKRSGKSGLARGERLQIMLSALELEAVDDFRFHHRMPSRAAAVRELFRLGLATVSGEAPADKRSAEFGVLDKTIRTEGDRGN